MISAPWNNASSHIGSLPEERDHFSSLKVCLLVKPICPIEPRTLRPRFVVAHLEVVGRERIEARGLEDSDRAMEVLMAKRVRACLRVSRIVGRIRAIPMADAPQGWLLVGGKADRLLRESHT